MTEVFDTIIVGAGSAGCVLANRLSRRPQHRVMLLESGPRLHFWDLWVHMPAALSQVLTTDRYNWFYQTQAEPLMNGRRMYCPRGKALGGSSSINGMIYIRGHALDYQRWADKWSLPNWSYAHCLPYFKRAESRALGGDTYRGDSGPLTTTTGSDRNPLVRAFLEAGVQAGYPYTKDVNGYQQEGIGLYDRTTRNGVRQSTAVAYLKQAETRPNLTIITRAVCQRVILDDSDRAVGVVYKRHGQLHTVHAEEQIILSGGAINSPLLLMHSGIGDADHLRSHQIQAKVHLSGVGKNLQDHLEIYVQYQCLKPYSLYPYLHPGRKIMAGLQWLLFKQGICASNHFEAGGFIRSHAGIEHPNLQYHFLPIAMNYDGSQSQKGHGFQLHVGPMRSASRGYVQLSDGSPESPPKILFNYLQADDDLKEMRAAVRLSREIIAQSAFAELRGAELAPGSNTQSDAEIDAFVRRHGESAYHPSCTCKMGVGEDAVVDQDAKVYGVEGLRIIDASIMPDIVSGNLNAPVIMIAEKLAAEMLGEPEPPLHVPFHVADNYAANQR